MSLPIVLVEEKSQRQPELISGSHSYGIQKQVRNDDCIFDTNYANGHE